MIETKRLTLEEAKAEIAELKRLNSGHCYVNDCLKQAESILARVKQPSQDDRAVLWLIREWDWTIHDSKDGWVREDGNDWTVFNPIKEAKKLGWRGGE